MLCFGAFLSPCPQSSCGAAAIRLTLGLDLSVHPSLPIPDSCCFPAVSMLGSEPQLWDIHICLSLSTEGLLPGHWYRTSWGGSCPRLLSAHPGWLCSLGCRLRSFGVSPQKGGQPQVCISHLNPWQSPSSKGFPHHSFGFPEQLPGAMAMARGQRGSHLLLPGASSGAGAGQLPCGCSQQCPMAPG